MGLVSVETYLIGGSKLIETPDTDVKLFTTTGFPITCIFSDFDGINECVYRAFQCPYCKLSGPP